MYQLPKELGTILDKELSEVTLLDLLVLSQSELDYLLTSILPVDSTTRVEGTIVVDPPMREGVDRRPLLCAHLDTVSKVPPRRKDIYRKNDTLHLNKRRYSTCLGGDDRAGVYIMLQLILSEHFDKYTYCFFRDEEIGCQGSMEFTLTGKFEELELRTSCFIGVDRKCKPGVPEIAQYGCNSDELDMDLEELLPEFKFTAGSITDCLILSEDSQDMIPCFNITAGYMNEHSTKETVHLPSMEYSLEALKKLELPDKQYEYEKFGFSPGSQITVGGMGGEYAEYAVGILCAQCGSHDLLYEHPDYNISICEWCLEDCIEDQIKEASGRG